MPEMPLWTPSNKRKQDSNLSRFKAGVEEKLKISLAGFEALHAWSVADSQAFWVELWDFCNIKSEYRGNRLAIDSDKLSDVGFFPDARLNYAQNLLIRDDDTPALIFRSEHKVRRSMSWRELQATVAELHRRPGRNGRGPGRPGRGDPAEHAGDDGAACWPPPRSARSGRPARRISASAGVLDRFGQIEPRVFIAVRRLLVQRQGASTSPTRSRRSPASCRASQRVVIVAYLGTRRGGWRRIAGAASTCDALRRAVRSRAASTSSGCRSTIRSTSCTRRARPACRSASCTAPAARCSST